MTNAHERDQAVDGSALGAGVPGDLFAVRAQRADAEAVLRGEGVGAEHVFVVAAQVAAVRERGERCLGVRGVDGFHAGVACVGGGAEPGRGRGLAVAAAVAVLNLGEDCRIWLYTPACDMRRSIDGLSVLVRRVPLGQPRKSRPGTPPP